jgi:hypothetical protein
VSRKPSQLAINQRQQLIRRRRLASLRGFKDARDFTHADRLNSGARMSNLAIDTRCIKTPFKALNLRALHEFPVVE